MRHVNLSSLMRDRTHHTPCTGRQSLDHWMPGKGPTLHLKVEAVAPHGGSTQLSGIQGGLSSPRLGLAIEERPAETGSSALILRGEPSKG